jgi:hypothetical protein
MRDGEVSEGGLDPGVHQEHPAGVVPVQRHSGIPSVDRDPRCPSGQAQFQRPAPERDRSGHAGRVEHNGVRVVGVQGAADLSHDLRTEVGRQGRAVDEGDGLAQRQVRVAGVGRVDAAVDQRGGRGQPALQTLQRQPGPAGLAARCARAAGSPRGGAAEQSSDPLACNHGQILRGRALDAAHSERRRGPAVQKRSDGSWTQGSGSPGEGQVLVARPLDPASAATLAAKAGPRIGPAFQKQSRQANS